MSTNTVQITLDVDESVLLSMREKKESFKKTILFYTALGLYRKGKLSLGKAAQLCHLNRIEFIKQIDDEGLSIFDYETDIVDDMIAKAGEKPR